MEPVIKDLMELEHVIVLQVLMERFVTIVMLIVSD